ncbi:MAG: TolC family protein [Prevotellaceae bacterium]|jgi:outer membrane protein TolC|nr:TolC family protein [Prevotellaceae bacterium]
MKKILLLPVLCLVAFPAQAGDTLSLAHCWALGEAAYPVTGNAPLLEEALQLKIKTLHTNYYPRLSVTAQASYQSDVTSLDLSALPFPMDMASPAKDQYKIALDVQQTIYDAGQTKHSQRVEELGTQEALWMNKADWHDRKQQIQQVYFAGLLYQSQKKIASLLIATLQQNLAQAASAAANGVLQPRDLHLLEVEKLNAEQQLTEASFYFTACLKMLEQFTQTAFPETAVLAIPETAGVTEVSTANRRAEWNVLEARKERLLAAKSLLAAEITPRVGLFGQAGYSRPGLNMLSNSFDPYYMVGVRVSWTPWNWGATQKSKKIQEVQAKIVGNQQSAFDEGVQAQAWNSRYEIAKQEQLMRQDVQLVALRRQITQESASQMANGVITAGDYIADLNAEMIARINGEIHLIRLAQACVELALIMNNE